MQYSKKGWDIISDIIRELGENPGMLNEYETNIFLKDIANLMDYI